VLAAADAAWAVKTSAPVEATQNQSILAAEPAPGQVASEESDADLGLTTVTFSNGVVLHHKYSDYRKDQVMVQIILPGGILEETEANRGISAAASLILSRPATSRFTSTQIQDLLTGRNLSFNGEIGLDTLMIGISASPTDLPLGMQLTYAMLTDPVLEVPALEDWKKREHQAIAARPTLAEAQLSEAMGKTLYGGDIRMLPLTDGFVDRQDVKSATEWYRHISDHAAIEVAIVGDIQKADAVALVAKYLGSLPKRAEGFDALDGLRTIKRAGGPFALNVELKSETPKALVTAGFIGCDERNPLRRPLGLASLILSDQMIQQIRIRDQLVYSIRCQSTPARSIPGTGTLAASAPTDPKNAEKLAEAVTDIIKKFAADGPTPDELVTAKKQIANQLVSQMPEPEFWVTLFGDMNYRGRPVKEIKELPGIFQTFTADQLRDAVRTCVEDDRSIRVEVIPQEGAVQAAAPGTRPSVH
jgi:zinc protease